MSEEKVELKTHKEISPVTNGKLVELKHNYARVVLETRQEMAVDELGLIHGGFIFGAADFCAMATINEPNVVLVSSQCKFLAPTQVGDIVEFESTIIFNEEKKQEVLVTGKIGDIKIFEGNFGTVVLPRHVLKLKITE
jgi:acyl-coenzyme A thioesterase PaaI-like protein